MPMIEGDEPIQFDRRTLTPKNVLDSVIRDTGFYLRRELERSLLFGSVDFSYAGIPVKPCRGLQDDIALIVTKDRAAWSDRLYVGVDPASSRDSDMAYTVWKVMPGKAEIVAEDISRLAKKTFSPVSGWANQYATLDSLETFEQAYRRVFGPQTYPEPKPTQLGKPARFDHWISLGAASPYPAKTITRVRT